ncbi:MAG: hypothetical protein ACI9ON_002304 [Limisphaerales bacterium]|jgi:hypothetical protein
MGILALGSSEDGNRDKMSLTQVSDEAPRMATITCSCGEVKLVLPNAVPKFRCGCCCTECLQRVYIGSLGLPPVAIKNLDEPVDLLYIDSQIMKPDPDTLAKLAVFKLNHVDASNINLSATCCGAVLLTENKNFHVPHTMATFHNLGHFLKCDFSKVPQPRLNVFTKDWPVEKAKALAAKEKSADGESLSQILDPNFPLEDASFDDLVSALQIEASPKPENSLCFEALRGGMEVRIEKAFFKEARSHVGG